MPVLVRTYTESFINFNTSVVIELLMAIVKLNEKRSIVMFIGDDLGVYFLPASVMRRVLDEPDKWPMVQLKRFRKDATEGQFKKSEYWGDEAASKNHEGTGLNFTKEKQIAAKPIEDKVVW